MSVRDYSVPVVRISLVTERVGDYGVNKVRSPRDACSLFDRFVGWPDREMLVLFLLDTKNVLLGIHTVSIGDINSSEARPPSVMKACLLANASSFLLVHNHPSGDPTFSPEDIAVARRMKEVGELLGIEQLDFVVTGGFCPDSGQLRFKSFAESFG